MSRIEDCVIPLRRVGCAGIQCQVDTELIGEPQPPRQDIGCNHHSGTEHPTLDEMAQTEGTGPEDGH